MDTVISISQVTSHGEVTDSSISIAPVTSRGYVIVVLGALLPSSTTSFTSGTLHVEAIDIPLLFPSAARHCTLCAVLLQLRFAGVGGALAIMFLMDFLRVIEVACASVLSFGRICRRG